MLDHVAHAETIIDGTKYTLYAFSVITWTLILFKIWQLSRNSSYNRTFNDAFWNSADLTTAEKLPEDITRGAEARIAQAGFQWLRESANSMGKTLKFHGEPAELLEHALLIQMQKEQHTMEGGLTILASIGSTAPFVGLFGTVLGIMHAMHQITASGSTNEASDTGRPSGSGTRHSGGTRTRSASPPSNAAPMIPCGAVPRHRAGAPMAHWSQVPHRTVGSTQ